MLSIQKIDSNIRKRIRNQVIWFNTGYLSDMMLPFILLSSIVFKSGEKIAYRKVRNHEHMSINASLVQIISSLPTPLMLINDSSHVLLNLCILLLKLYSWPYPVNGCLLCHTKHSIHLHVTPTNDIGLPPTTKGLSNHTEYILQQITPLVFYCLGGPTHTHTHMRIHSCMQTHTQTHTDFPDKSYFKKPGCAWFKN